MIGSLLALGLAVVHGFAAQFPIDRLIPMRRWLSFAGGVSLTYVFLEIFPELAHAQEELQHSESIWSHYLDNHVYVLALLGLIFFYLLDAVILMLKTRQSLNQPQDFSLGFWIHLSVFALLNLITGYLIQELSHTNLTSCLLFFTAIALHFFIIDEHLRENHPISYDRLGRWLLVGAIILGAIVGQTTVLNPLWVIVIWSFLAGSIILNVLKRELPDESENCMVSFVLGTGVFASLLFLQ